MLNSLERLILSQGTAAPWMLSDAFKGAMRCYAVLAELGMKV